MFGMSSIAQAILAAPHKENKTEGSCHKVASPVVIKFLGVLVQSSSQLGLNDSPSVPWGIRFCKAGMQMAADTGVHPCRSCLERTIRGGNPRTFT
eukprot:1755698-Amphidinium_carterae.1